MAIYTSDVNRVTGLSGIDTDSMIDKLMQSESAKLQGLKRDEMWTTWRQDSYREIIKTIEEFQEKWLGIDRSNNISYNAAWNNYVTSVTDEDGKESTAITINSSSEDGNYEISVNKVAQTETITGNSKTRGEIITGKTAVEIAQSIKDNGKLSLTFGLDGTGQNIEISYKEIEDYKIANPTTTKDEDALKEVLQAKLTQNFGGISGNAADPKVKANINVDGKLEFTVGDGHGLTIADGETPVTKDTQINLGSDILDKSKEGKFELTVTTNGKDYTITADIKKNTTPEDRLKLIVNSFKSAKDGTGKTIDISKRINVNFDIKTNSAGDKELTISNKSSDEIFEIGATFDGTVITQKQKINPQNNTYYFGISEGESTVVWETDKLMQVFGNDYKKYFETNKNADNVLEFDFGGKGFVVTEDETIESFINKVNGSNSKIKLGFNDITGRFKMESTESGANGIIKMDPATSQKEITFLKDFIGIDVANKQTGNGSYIAGQDAEFTVDGITTTRPTNDIKMNGLNFTINRITGVDANGKAKKVNLLANNDEDATFKKIKDFVTDYNKLIETVEKKVLQERPKSDKYSYYEPMLEEEKKGLSEEEIKKYEGKAKEGTLHRDSILEGFLSDLRSFVYEPIDIGGGKKLSLGDIGIGTTKDYNSDKLEIDEAKLKKALAERGDDVAKLFTTNKIGIGNRINEIIEDNIGSTGILSKKAGVPDTSTVNNNIISKEILSIQENISKENKRLRAKESYYYDMFSRMEASMNIQNSQMSVLLSSLGQG